MSEKQIIYHATTEADCEGRTSRSLGYFTGEKRNIEQYLEDQKSYNIYLNEIGPVKHITPEDIAGKKELLERKNKLEQELKFINSQL